MKLVLFGLTVSSSWGNGHATLLRGLLRALADRGHDVVFFEKDVPYYAAHRDMHEGDGFRLRLYREWGDARQMAMRELAGADVALVTSYAPDARAATDLVRDRDLLRVYYDLDAPVTLEAVRTGRRPEYLPADGFAAFDLVLSYAGGRACDDLARLLGARRVAPLYGSVDPTVHRKVAADERFACDLSYLGTYAADRHPQVERLFIAAARLEPTRSFVLGGPQYPPDIAWPANVRRFEHVGPAEHGAFYSSSGATLSLTRRAMIEYGYCPSGRLFEAAACGTMLLSDPWPGIAEFYRPGEEILLVRDARDVLDALSLPAVDRRRIVEAARERTMRSHTAAARADGLLRLLEDAATARSAPTLAEAV